MVKNIYFFLCKVSDILQKPLEFLIAFFMYAGVLAIVFQVLYRYVLVRIFTFSFPYTEEFSRYALIWMTFLGAGIVLKEGTLISLSLLYDRLRGISKYALYYVTRVLMLFFMFAVIRYGIDFLPFAQMFRSPVLGISGVFLYMMPVVGCILMSYETIVDVFGVISGEQEPFTRRMPRKV